MHPNTVDKPDDSERVMLVPIQHEMDAQSHNKGLAFVLWLSCLFGLCGVHRFYLGRPVSGILYLLTFGFFGIGQLVDLFLLPSMVDEENTKRAALKALAEKRALHAGPRYGQLPAMLPPAPQEAAPTPEKVRIKLVQAAAKYGGKLSVTQGVMATGKSFEEVENILDTMVRSGYVDVTNDENTGVVVYDFGQLQL
ncbi:TM2 domain-containing protein [Haliangium ochraceum]|uniref:TM2 domain containing protein n=1 Tax=Haliangium ochraceum (strain DSM 14365 / JCM 11303 / SMP-2) TaxID=502025 RepID=D0LU62_HALO1|nr:TM2 domain-containing protein [Haliangium ochraceum]ACY17426.1 TM2 domain containing protein [Haliangium ochraceum DSM 14365]